MKSEDLIKVLKALGEVLDDETAKKRAVSRTRQAARVAALPHRALRRQVIEDEAEVDPDDEGDQDELDSEDEPDDDGEDGEGEDEPGDEAEGEYGLEDEDELEDEDDLDE
jgi:hypothetical protein